MSPGQTGQPEDYELYLPNESDVVIDRLVSFLYTLDYGDESDLTDDIVMFSMAAENNIPGLVTKATEKFRYGARNWDLDFMKDNFEVVEKVIRALGDDTEDENWLSDIFVRFLIDIDAFAKKSPICESMMKLTRDNPWFSECVIRGFARRKSERRIQLLDLDLVSKEHEWE